MSKENKNEHLNISDETLHFPFIKGDAIHAVERLAKYAEEVTKAYQKPKEEERDMRGDMILKVARIKGKVLAVSNDDFLDKAGALNVVMNSVQELIEELKTTE